MEKSNLPRRTKRSSGRGVGQATSSSRAKPILDNPEELLRRNTVPVQAREGEQTAEIAAPPVTNVADAGIPVAAGGAASGQQVLSNDDSDTKMVVPKLDVESITNLVVDRAAHELADQVPALVYQFLERDAREYIDQMVQESLQEHRQELLHEFQTAAVMTPAVHGNPKVFAAGEAVQPNLPINQIGETPVDLVRERADPRGEEGPKIIYLLEPVGNSARGPGAGDPGGGSSSSSEDERRRKPKGKKKAKKVMRKGHRSDPESSDSDTDSDVTSNDDRRSTRKSRKDTRRKKRKLGRNARSKRYELSESGSDTDDNLEVIHPLNDLFTKAVDYKTYRLENRSSKYTSSVAQKITKQHKRLSFQMGDTTFSGDDPIAIIDFLQRFKIACDQNGFSEGASMWLFQFYLMGQAASLLHSRMQGNTMAVDEEQTEMLKTYSQVVNYLLETYATDEVIQEAYAEVLSHRQRSGQTETEFAKSLFAMASRCGNVFTTTRLKSMLADNIDASIRAQVRNYLADNRKVDYNGLTRYAQALGDTHRAGKRQPTAGSKPTRDKDKVKPKWRVLEVDYSTSSEDGASATTPMGTGVHIIDATAAHGPATPSSNWSTTSGPTASQVSTPSTVISAPSGQPFQVFAVPNQGPMSQTTQASYRTAATQPTRAPGVQSRTPSMALKDPTTGNLLCWFCSSPHHLATNCPTVAPPDASSAPRSSPAKP